MSKQVPWNKIIVETFVSEAMLTQEEEMILRTRLAGWPRSKQSIELGMSISTIDKHISMLKKKYDRVAKYNPLLPPRKSSAMETWMDEN